MVVSFVTQNQWNDAKGPMNVDKPSPVLATKGEQDPQAAWTPFIHSCTLLTLNPLHLPNTCLAVPSSGHPPDLLELELEGWATVPIERLTCI
jgi:hypothetical protein